MDSYDHPHTEVKGWARLTQPEPGFQSQLCAILSQGLGHPPYLKDHVECLNTELGLKHAR